MQEQARPDQTGQWPCHPDSLKATFMYRIPMFILGVVVGYIVYGVARFIFGG